MNTNSNAVEAKLESALCAPTWAKSLEHVHAAIASLTTTEDGDICDGCDNAYKSVFRVPDEVWSQIAPKPDSLGEHIEHQYGGLLCLNCADNAARKAGITLVWEARLNWDSATEDGLEPTTGFGSFDCGNDPYCGGNKDCATHGSPTPSGDVVEALQFMFDQFGGNLADPDYQRIEATLTTPQHTTSPDALLREAGDSMANAADKFTAKARTMIYPKPDKPESDYGLMLELDAAISGWRDLDLDQHLQGGQP